MPYVQEQIDAADARADREIEDFFAKQEKGFRDIFGKGSTENYPEDSQERTARTKLVQEAFALQDSYAERGKPITLEDALNRALSMLYQDRIKELAVKEKAQKMKKREAQISARVTSERRSGVTTAEQRAIEDIARKAIAKGMFER